MESAGKEESQLVSRIITTTWGIHANRDKL
jgi:hypothetical protein